MARLAAATRAVLAACPAILAGCRRRQIPEPASGARLSPHLASLLEHLDPHRAVTVSELARRLQVTPATISLQLARLVDLGLVGRTRDRKDGRRVLLRLTEAGVRLGQTWSLLDPSRVRAALGRLSSRERAQSVGGLRALARAATELTANRRVPKSEGRAAGPAIRRAVPAATHLLRRSPR